MIRADAFQAAISWLAENDSLPRAMGTSAEAGFGGRCVNCFAGHELHLKLWREFAALQVHQHSRPHSVTPARKSSNGVLSSRLFFKLSRSAKTSNGFLFVRQRLRSPAVRFKQIRSRVRRSQIFISGVIRRRGVEFEPRQISAAFCVQSNSLTAVSPDREPIASHCDSRVIRTGSSSVDSSASDELRLRMQHARGRQERFRQENREAIG